MPANTEVSSRASQEVLAQIIRDYWKSRGHTVKVTVEPAGSDDNGTNLGWKVITDLKDALPRAVFIRKAMQRYE